MNSSFHDSRTRDDGRISNLSAFPRFQTSQGHVEIMMNVAWPELFVLFGRASAGIHTMRNEHFGINVVEFMASGVIPVSNNSGKRLGTSLVLIKKF